MNKRILVMGILLTFLFLLVGCDTQTTTTTTSSETTTTTTSGVSVVTSNTAVALADSIPSDCAITTVEDGWVPVWCDEFQYTGGVDLSKWSVVVGGGGFGNNELQYYTNRQENLYVDGEYLNITALMENYGGYNYTSAKIWTTNTETWKYGKFEMRAKLPAGRGTWPAFWMMPASSKYGGWPDSGEIDIMEHVGYDMNVVHGTIHTDRFNGSNGRGGSTSILLTEGLVTSIDVANEFHTYGIEWDETSITWFYDGLAFASVGYDPELSGTVL
ncbi:MAG: glycoside hydrolase family 16 protein, partial [Candidatus Izemoplasmatales bacterium]|nr:glycoside hydrolase family 16 protein [Candidatus Izemoplasmatales bacterium]